MSYHCRKTAQREQAGSENGLPLQEEYTATKGQGIVVKMQSNCDTAAISHLFAIPFSH
jgi:hypothetical protein